MPSERRSRLMRVDPDFYDLVMSVGNQNKIKVTETTKLISIDIKNRKKKRWSILDGLL